MIPCTNDKNSDDDNFFSTPMKNKVISIDSDDGNADTYQVVREQQDHHHQRHGNSSSLDDDDDDDNKIDEEGEGTSQQIIRRSQKLCF